MVNKPLIRPYFWGGGGQVDYSHEPVIMTKLLGSHEVEGVIGAAWGDIRDEITI